LPDTITPSVDAAGLKSRSIEGAVCLAARAFCAMANGAMKPTPG
jgi:hypothetical protein